MNLNNSLYSRRLFLTLLFLSGCTASQKLRRDQFVVGTVSYDAGTQTIADTYDRFDRYLAEQLKAIVQLEPAFSEAKALERLKAQAWSLVFAPPGLAAIAISEYQYISLFPLIGVNNLKSVIVVPNSSSIQDKTGLVGKRLAISQPGSATGYYFPIFNLYGLTLAELVVSPTPKSILEAVAQGKADAGALSLEEFNTIKRQIPQTEFRVVFQDNRAVPSGSILLSPKVDRTFQESVRKILSETPSAIAQETGFIPTEPPPDYDYMISVVKRVRSIFPADDPQTGAALLSKKPARLFQDGDAPPTPTSDKPTPVPSKSASP
ncbi:MAG: PhnD/SsuA/transferrin family substrate-binding protein [Thermosynechococcaceae cyanobacterium]